ncbi:MAG TPA: alcohol dehydrogenase catalytic domain-containing protein [Polyangia bacterium]
MRAALFRQYGGPEVMEVAEVPTPVAGPGEVLVKVRAAALNHFDLWARRGLPALQVPLPHVPGGDIVGEIAALGAGVSKLDLGTRVVVNPGLTCGRCVRCQSGQDNLCPEFRMVGEHTWGGQAEFIAVPVTNVVRAPANVSDVDLASLPTTFMTAWQMLVDKAAVKQGETVLVLSAGSGVGVAAIQIAKLFGARVLATASSAAKLDRLSALGADEVAAVENTQASIISACKRWAPGKGGIDVVIEHAGGESFKAAVKVAAKGGRIVTCGATGDYEPTLNLRYIFWRQIAVLGSTMAPKGRLHQILDLVAAGKLRAAVDRSLPLEQVGEAHRILEARQAVGKLVLTPT